LAAAAAAAEGEAGAGGSVAVEAAAAAAASGGDAEVRLREEVEAKRASLVQWCLASYGEAFSSWIHVTAVRLFVESILRYGLPPRFLAVLMKPAPRHRAQLRKVLGANFGAVGGHHFTSEGGGEDVFPYVSFALDIEEQ
jgi:V-type H+-transporting ATPase subunit C